MAAPLLAKTGQDVTFERTLTGHTKCVLRAVDALFVEQGHPTRLARSWLRFFGIPGGAFGRFVRHLRVAAAAHDWGKANDGFQGAVTAGGQQVVRHEHLSGLLLAELLSDYTVRHWLNGSGLDEVVILAAVISHHVKAGRATIGSPSLTALGGVVRLLSNHEDFSTVWEMFQEEVGSKSPIPPRFPSPWRWKKADIEKQGRELQEVLDRAKRHLRDDPSRRRLVQAVRAGLIVADSVGSAVVRMDRGEGGDAEATLARWVRGCFSTTLSGSDVWTKVTRPRVEDLRSRGRWDDKGGHAFADERGFSEFQVAVAGQGPRVLLTAPCGSGKTLAAWNWIKAQLDELDRRHRPASRVLFLYPTRATATEGFRDYVSWAPEDDAGLLSGTADYELQDMFTTPDDGDDPRWGRDFRPDPRLFALGHWKKRIFSATADQFFPFMQYGYGPLCLLPLLAESILVVDEIHSFDASMFSTLRRFLKEFPDVPTLCMTATLPGKRREELVMECNLRPYPETPPADLVRDSGHPRYHVEWIDRGQAATLVREELDKRRRILWVSNRVRDCQAVLGKFYDNGYIGPGAISAYCYHSRFKLDDRKERHKQLIRAFQDSVQDGAVPQAILGATTQVCEMSLDLDAEILVTELAPIASLIQRMGRCNRDSAKLRDRPIGRVYVLRPEPGKEKPYEKEDLDIAERFVNKLAGRDVSQVALEEVFRECDPGEVEPEKLCPFLDSGPYAEARETSFRETDEFTVPCVLDHDLPKVLDILGEPHPAKREPIDGFIVPVPRRFANEKRPEGSRFPRWLSVAPGACYNALTGFEDRDRRPVGDLES